MFIPGYGATSDVDSQISDLESELESLTRGASAPTLRRVGGLGPSDNLQEQHDRSRGRVSRPSSGSNTARIEELRGRLDQLRGQRAGISASPPSAPDYSAFYKSPGYEFRFDEGARAVGRGASARGRRLGGAHERELIRYGQGVASSEFNSYANRLASLAGLGQTSAAQTGQAGAQAASSQGAYLAGEGTARASGYVGAANAATSGIGNYLFYAGLQNQG